MNGQVGEQINKWSKYLFLALGYVLMHLAIQLSYLTLNVYFIMQEYVCINYTCILERALSLPPLATGTWSEIVSCSLQILTIGERKQNKD